MDWFQQIDIYCERNDFAYWAEPVNALSNGAFIVAALVVWAVLGGKSDAGARILTGILVLVGIGSFLFHTQATRWALMADVLPIMAFTAAYLYLASRRFLEWPEWTSIGAVIAFFPLSAGLEWLIRANLGSLNGSVGYIPILLLIGLYALMMMPRDVETARGLAIAAGLLTLSLVFRTADAAVCNIVPLGTHFIWHTLNGIALGWMIVVLHRHEVHPDPLAPGGLPR